MDEVLVLDEMPVFNCLLRFQEFLVQRIADIQGVVGVRGILDDDELFKEVSLDGSNMDVVEDV